KPSSTIRAAARDPNQATNARPKPAAGNHRSGAGRPQASGLLTCNSTSPAAASNHLRTLNPGEGGPEASRGTSAATSAVGRRGEGLKPDRGAITASVSSPPPAALPGHPPSDLDNP